MPDDLTRYRDALATILIMCDKDPCCPSCGHPNGLPAIFGVASRALDSLPRSKETMCTCDASTGHVCDYHKRNPPRP